MDWANLAGIALQTIAIIFSLGAFVMRLHLDLRLWIQQSQATATEVAQIKQKMEKIADLITQLAIQDTRLNSIEARVHELSNIISRHIKKDS
jgi:hypothetical protein